MRKLAPFQEQTIATRNGPKPVKRCLHCNQPEREKFKITRGCCPTYYQTLNSIVVEKGAHMDDVLVARGYWLPNERSLKKRILADLDGKKLAALTN